MWISNGLYSTDSNTPDSPVHHICDNHNHYKIVIELTLMCGLSSVFYGLSRTSLEVFQILKFIF